MVQRPAASFGARPAAPVPVPEESVPLGFCAAGEAAEVDSVTAGEAGVADRVAVWGAVAGTGVFDALLFEVALQPERAIDAARAITGRTTSWSRVDGMNFPFEFETVGLLGLSRLRLRRSAPGIGSCPRRLEVVKKLTEVRWARTSRQAPASDDQHDTEDKLREA